MPEFSAVIAILAVIPATFWGVVIGSFFTILGIGLTNRANDRRLDRQLANDRDLKQQERELSLRKDIYLGVAEAVAAGTQTIARFADPSVPSERVMDGFGEKSAAIMKAHLVATPTTARAITSFTTVLTIAAADLALKRTPGLRHRLDVERLDAVAARFSKASDETLEAMKQLNLEGAADSRRWKVLSDNFDREHEELNKAIAAKIEANRQVVNAQVVYTRELHRQLRNLRECFPPLVAAMRAELGVPEDGPVLEQIMNESYATIDAKLADVLKAVERMGQEIGAASGPGPGDQTSS